MINIEAIRLSGERSAKAILYQHRIPSYRQALFEYLRPEIAVSSTGSKVGKIVGYLISFKLMKYDFKITISYKFLFMRCLIIPNNPYDLGLWVIICIRYAINKCTFYRGHAGSIKTYGKIGKIVRGIINNLQVKLSDGMFGYVAKSSASFQSTNYSDWSNKYFGSNNIHILWRGIRPRHVGQRKTAFFVGTNKKKQNIPKLLEFIIECDEIKCLHLIGNFGDLCLSHANQKLIFHGEIYDEAEKDYIINDCDFGLSVGSLGLFVIDCLARNRPLLALSRPEHNLEHAPEALFLRDFPGSDLARDISELKTKINALHVNNIDYEAIYQKSYTYKSIKDVYLSAINDVTGGARK